MARPRIQIDTDLLESLAEIQCTNDEMAIILGCSKDTLERRFAAVIKSGREKGKRSLRRRQYEVAMSGNVGMLVWLGKQYLGQSDKSEDKLTAEVKGSVIHDTTFGDTKINP